MKINFPLQCGLIESVGLLWLAVDLWPVGLYCPSLPFVSAFCKSCPLSEVLSCCAMCFPSQLFPCRQRLQSAPIPWFSVRIPSRAGEYAVGRSSQLSFVSCGTKYDLLNIFRNTFPAFFIQYIFIQLYTVALLKPKTPPACCFVGGWGTHLWCE